MNLINKLLLPFLIIAAIASIWYAHHLNDRSQRTNTTAPGFFATDIKQLSTRLDQSSSSILYAKKMADHEKLGVIAYTQPKLMLYQDQTLRWTIRAQKAMVNSREQQIITLDEQVIVTRLPFGDQPRATILTEHLVVEPKMNTAHTDQPVQIEQPHAQTSAVGLRSNLKTGTIELLSKVKTHYATSSSS